MYFFDSLVCGPCRYLHAMHIISSGAFPVLFSGVQYCGEDYQVNKCIYQQVFHLGGSTSCRKLPYSYANLQYLHKESKRIWLQYCKWILSQFHCSLVWTIREIKEKVKWLQLPWAPHPSRVFFLWDLWTEVIELSWEAAGSEERISRQRDFGRADLVFMTKLFLFRARRGCSGRLHRQIKGVMVSEGTGKPIKAGTAKLPLGSGYRGQQKRRGEAGSMWEENYRSP